MAARNEIDTPTSTEGMSSDRTPAVSPVVADVSQPPKHTGNMKVILQSPTALKAEYPANDAHRAFVAASRAEIADILHGRSSKLLVVTGPCSIHDTGAALEYGRRLAELSKKHSNDLLVVMRVYCEKPRTGMGWKGLVRDPFLDGTNDIGTGLAKSRQLLLQLTTMGLPCACEFLDPMVTEYIADLVSWGAIGARTSESQLHREMASGLQMPIGFKNSTNGSLHAAVDGAAVASRAHSYICINPEGHVAVNWTTGNPNCHIVLRGGHQPNYEKPAVLESLAAIEKRYQSHSHPGRTHRHVGSVIIDCSHGNSKKDFRNQPTVAKAVGEQLEREAHGRHIAGVMLESFLNEGSQPLIDGCSLEYGKSITDSCISMRTTEDVLAQLASSTQSRRKLLREEDPAVAADDAIATRRKRSE